MRQCIGCELGQGKYIEGTQFGWSSLLHDVACPNVRARPEVGRGWLMFNVNIYGVSWIERIPLTRPSPPNHYYRNAAYLMSLSPRHGQETSHRDGTTGQGCVVLSISHPMTEEPNSLPYPTSSARLFGRHGGTLSLPQPSSRDSVLHVPFAGDGNKSDVPRKWTQMDQDATDEKARKRAMGELVQSWMDRLHLISVIVSPLVLHKIAIDQRSV
ncbi:hypothetical protein C8Q70DRAFT_404229 [Cubamyces menziesii]|nr:hypothetical protein C8Q70DRAFT_404229 [Cubamyces menziesii]